MKTKTQGFTLVEIGVVLLIIGLLSGGIMLGRDMILAARIRAQISQIEQLNGALTSFKLKYNCLPGDCAQAVSLELGTSGGEGDNGNGNGMIESRPGTPYVLHSPELSNVFYHLSGAGLITGRYPGYRAAVVPVVGIDSPALKIDGDARTSTPVAYQNIRGGIWPVPIDGSTEVGLSVMMGYSGHVWFFGSTIEAAQSAIWLSGIVHAIDTKLDDGMPRSGKVQAVSRGIGGGGPDYSVGHSTPTPPCLDYTTSPMTYNLQSTVPGVTSACALLVKTPL